MTISVFAQTTLSRTNQNSQIFKEDPELTKSLQKILKKHKLDSDIKTSDGKLERVSLVVVDLFDPENPVFGAINPHLNRNPAGMERIFIATTAMEQKVQGIYDLMKIIIANESNVVDFPIQQFDIRRRIEAGHYKSVGILIDLVLTRNDLTAANELIDIVSRDSIQKYLEENGFTDTIVNKKYKVPADRDFPEYKDLPENATSAYDVARYFYLLYMTKILDDESAELMRRYFRRNLISGYIADGLGQDSVFYHYFTSDKNHTNEAGTVVQKKLSYIISLFAPLSEETAKEKFPNLTWDIHCLIIDRAMDRVKKDK